MRSRRGFGRRRPAWPGPRSGPRPPRSAAPIPTTDRRPRPESPDAYQAALRLLARRAHSETELRLKLRRRRLERPEIDGALARLRERGYLDDAAFARSLVARRSAIRGRSALAAELRGRGIGRGLADAALVDLDPEAEVEAAERLAGRFGAGVSRDLIAARLHRRGFGMDVIRRALRRLETPDQG